MSFLLVKTVTERVRKKMETFQDYWWERIERCQQLEETGNGRIFLEM